MANFNDLDALLQDFVERDLLGCALQISQKGDILYEGYFGFADSEREKPITNQSVFRQASMSKLPLYTTLMMLYEQGRFLLSDPIYEFFPEWKDTYKCVTQSDGSIEIVPTEGPITVRDLLSMTCGLPYCNFPQETNDPTLRAMQKHMQPLWDVGHYTLREHVAAMSKVPLAFEPGTQWLYGFSSELAAGLVEVVCDKPIDDVFKEFIFDPLGMDDTRSRYFGDIRERMVALHKKDANMDLPGGIKTLDRKHEPGIENETGWARLFSTVNDFSKLMQVLANGGEYNGVRIIGRKTLDLMRANGLNEVQQKDFDNIYNNGYGYGYGVRTLIDKQKGNHNGSLGAFGWTGGFGTWCEASPSDGVSIVYMHNMVPNDEEYYHLRMRNVAYGCLK